jgi:nicotinate-nucleotide pyrophosphorylase (carboxylating)
MQYEQITTLPLNYIKNKISEFLDEDIPNEDVTTSGIFDGKEIATADVIAEEDLTLAGAFIIPYFFEHIGKVELILDDGVKIINRTTIARITAPTNIILSRERVLLNLLQRLCGIATLTSVYAEIAKPWNVKILDTRKTTPGLRLFEKYAVTAGGGFNHRLNLSTGILIKDNHIKAAGGIIEAIKKIRTHQKNFKIEVETENIEEVRQALEAAADCILLDNMSPENIIESVKEIRNFKNGEKIFIEASGGINLNNLKDYVQTSVNAISVGALTHSAKSANIHLEFN